MVLDFIVLGVIAVIGIVVVAGLVFAINVLVWKVNHLESEAESLKKDVVYARAQVDSLRLKLSEARNIQRKTAIGN